MSVVINGTTGITSAGGDSSAADNTINGVRVGRGAGSVSTNTVVGASALNANTSGGSNVAVGNQALQSNTTANNNTAVGYQSLYNSTGGNNTALGYLAGSNVTTGAYNVSLGRYSGGAQSASTGSDNTSVGNAAGSYITSGSYNTAVGSAALQSNTTASNNTAVGYQAGYSNTTGQRSTYIGFKAGYTCTGESNTAVGYGAGQLMTSGSHNTLVGGRSDNGVNEGAGFNLTTGTYNNFFGGGAGGLVTTGSKNTVLGNYNGNQGGLDIRTASNYIVLSDGDGNPRQIIDNLGNWIIGKATITTGAVGADIRADGRYWSSVSGSNTYHVYNTASGTYKFYIDAAAGQIYATSTSISSLSDASLKKNIRDLDFGLAEVMALRPRRFDWIGGAVNVQGFVAQEVEVVMPDLVTDQQYSEEETKKSLRMGDMLPTLVKAIQELKADLDATKAELAALKGTA